MNWQKKVLILLIRFNTSILFLPQTVWLPIKRWNRKKINIDLVVLIFPYLGNCRCDLYSSYVRDEFLKPEEVIVVLMLN